MKYNTSLITFVDVLGFSELVRKLDAQAISKILAAFESANTPPLKSKYNPKLIQFSDSLVRVRRIDSKSNIKRPSSILFSELIALVFAQIELISQKILIRGGMTLGNIAIEHGNVFGPAMIDAHEIESKFAIYPRIALSPFLIGEAKANHLLWKMHHTAEDELASYKELISCDSDGIWFVDYLRASSNNLLDSQEHVILFFESHKSLILDGFKQLQGLTSASSKYLWLAAYHNRTVRRCKSHLSTRSKGDFQSLLISESEAPLLKNLHL